MEFWIELNDLGNVIEGAWCVGGDFNEILYSGDMNMGAGSGTQMGNVHSWILDFALIDPPLQNIGYTWSNFRVNATWSRLDRLFVTK